MLYNALSKLINGNKSIPRKAMTYTSVPILFLTCIFMLLTQASSSNAAAIQRASQSHDNPQFSPEAKPTPVLSTPATAYVDTLIDPNSPADTLVPLDRDTLSSARSTIFQRIEFHNSFQRYAPVGDNRYASGLSYNAHKDTINYGQFSFDITALYEPENNQRVTLQNNTEQLEISHYTLSQYQFPLTESLSMDNKLGMHRLNNRLSHHRLFISRRFSAASPDILGFSSNIYQDNRSFSISFGKLGNSYSQLLQGFQHDNSDVINTKFQQSFNKHFLSFDLWKTTNRPQESDNRIGSVITLDSILPNHFNSSVTAAISGGAHAFLAGLEQQKERFNQSAGFYYYAPDFLWIDRILGNDNIGMYYRFSDTSRAVNYGASLEWQRLGLRDSARLKRNTIFFSSHVGYRLNRANQFNLTYRYRESNDLTGLLTDSSTKQHYVRSYWNTQHSTDTRSTASLSLQVLSPQLNMADEYYSVANYSLSHAFNNGANGDISLEYTHNDTTFDVSRSYDVSVGWQQSFQGHQLSLNVGYRMGDSSRVRDNNWTANIAHYWTISDHFFISSNLSYNRNVFKLIADPNQLITESEPLLDSTYLQELSATINLSYNFGGSQSPAILSTQAGKHGSGRIHGRIIIDENTDGMAQAHEKGLVGIEVYLNSQHLTRTDEEGYFYFTSVGVGEHSIFIDESSLPLPWSLNGQEFHPITVRLRRTSRLVIPITTIDQNN